ncbi:MAG: patatin family protein [Bacteroidales bacterium]|nr:patatin family protein [Clostridium sp.]MCM1202517.1 patatin family protein [Bacteroidales bacterium]
MIQEELRTRKAGLVLEGGASRGVFTAGALDYLLERDFFFPYVIGVSAGACNGVSYVSRQKGRSFNCMAPERKEDQYKNTVKEAIRQRSVYDMDKLFGTFPKETFPYDFDTYIKGGMECEMVVTNVYTGKAEYMTDRESPERLCTICRASSSLPVMAPMVMIDGIPYLDGGLADSIPLKRALRTGHKKNVLILTRPYGYRKKFPSKSARLYIALFKDYPNLVKAIYYRPYYYNKTMDAIERLEKEGRIFVLRPVMPCPGRTEMNHEKLTAFYHHGYNTMEMQFADMKRFLGL